MGRKYIPKVHPASDGTIRFVPDLDDNRKDPEPFAVGMRVLKYGDLAELDTTHSAILNDNPSMTVWEFERERDLSTIAKYIDWVENYECVSLVSGQVNSPKTGEELVVALRETSIEEAKAVIAELMKALNGSKDADAGFLPVLS